MYNICVDRASHRHRIHTRARTTVNSPSRAINESIFFIFGGGALVAPLTKKIAAAKLTVYRAALLIG